MDVSGRPDAALARRIAAPFVTFHAAVQRMVYAVDNTDRVDIEAVAVVRDLVRDYVPDADAADRLAGRVVAAVHEADERRQTGERR